MTAKTWNITWIALLLAGLLSAGSLSAQTRGRDQKKAKATTTPTAHLKTKRIIGLDWYPSLDGAIAANEKSARDKRPILYMRVLGDLEGKT